MFFEQLVSIKVLQTNEATNLNRSLKIIAFVFTKKMLKYQGIGYLQKIYHKLTKTNYLLVTCCKEKKNNPKVPQSLASPVHFVVAYVHRVGSRGKG